MTQLRDPLSLPSDLFLSVRRGIESRILYNSLLLNERRSADQYLVSEINGLDDADLRDDRLDNPDRHGETAFTALYGGRTVTLKGEVRAGNLSMLRKLETELLGAFWDIEEKELGFLFLDYFENFSKANIANDFTVDSGTLVPNNTLKRFTGTTATNNVAFHNIRSYIDSFVSIKYTAGSGVATGGTFGMLKRLDSTNYLYCGVSHPSTLQINKLDANVTTTLATVALPASLIAGNTYWLRCYIDDNDVTVEHWATEPDNTSEPTKTLRFTLLTTNATKYGTGVSGRGGFRVNPPDSSWSYTNFDLRALNPGDIMVSARKSGKIEFGIPDIKQAKNPFLITLRSSDHRLLSRYPLKSNISNISLVVLVFAAAGAGITFPTDGSGISFLTDVVSVNNLGQAPASPVIRIFGQIVNPSVANATTGDIIALNGTINSGDYWEIDTVKRTIVDSGGNNQYGRLADTYDWIDIAPGVNRMAAGADSQSGASILFIFNHSW